MKEFKPQYAGTDSQRLTPQDSAGRGLSGRSASIVSATIVLVIATLCILPPSINGQTDPPPGGRPSSNLPPAEQPRPPSIRERQFILSEMERERARPRTPEEEKLALAQIAEDFQRIQIINNKMMSATVSRPIPDYRSIANTTSEIRKLASRIRDNLRLPKPASDEKEKAPQKKIIDAPRMKAALLSLDGSIMSFINNSIFKNPGVVDVKEGERARRDLETVIEFSQLISKEAEKLSNDSARRP